MPPPTAAAITTPTRILPAMPANKPVPAAVPATAPGVNVTGAFPGGRFSPRTGSCISAAVTSGAVALMLEWLLDIQEVPGIDSFQIKSLLILGAVRPKTMEYPNREWGYGQLNLYNTFETMRQL